MSTYSLRIKGFTPNTLPLGRLGQYVCALAEMVGDDILVSFDKVTKGSAALKIQVDDDSAPAVVSRIQKAPFADEGSASKRGYEKLQCLLAADRTSAEFRPAKGAVILKFTGAAKSPLRLACVREYGEINGRIIKLGGRDETVPVVVITPDSETINCTATVDMAKKLKAYLLEPVDVILSGMGRWKRTDSGTWEMTEFKINDVQEMLFGSFDEGLASIRKNGSGWNGVEDITQELRRLRYGE